MTTLYKYHVSLLKYTQITIMNKAVSSTPMFIRNFSEVWLDSIRFERRKAVTTGLYKIIVIAAFNPPLIILKGKNAGSSSSATASLG